MNLSFLMEKIKKHPEYNRMGMILCHNGVVRSTSRDGRQVSGLDISVERGKLEQIIETHKKKPGIIEIIVEVTDDGYLTVGDDIMLLLVAGDIRENVIPVLHEALNDIKRIVTSKTEHYV
jgi:molybdopterin synthase catalytic subunit